MRIAIALVLLAVATSSANAAKAYKLNDFNIEDVKTKCASVHGKFFTNPEGTYGCVYGKGIVQCDTDQHCKGVLKEAQHRMVHRPAPAPAPAPRYREYDHWYQW